MQPTATQSESIGSALVGTFYSRFAVDLGFDLYFEGFVLSAQDVAVSDEESINTGFVSSYQPSACTANPQLIAKSVVLAACLGIEVSAVDIAEDSSLSLRFGNGVVIRLPTDTPVVDWHWAFTESGGDPYVGCFIACFAPGDIQGNMPNQSFKPNPLRGSA
jgi:hypothetical protein